ncbi:MBL fold metallo-hydrolase [Streptomyces sp. SCSIO 75703]|uniref:MBL fold metallo-hydrolase n=1 Tax=unclassified Streptomyces TaxID=2593676 RepID=UPI0004BF1CCF|nr:MULTISPECIES: MBL fold metallo-hydrolase [unclassified Streptomyces]
MTMCNLCDATPAADTGEASSGTGGGLGRRSVLTALGATSVAAGLSGVAAPAAAAAPGTGKPGKNRWGKLDLVLLGTKAGPPVDPLRTGISTALVVDGATYVVDCGRAAATQYVRAGLTMSSLSGIFITHLHADHVADYYNFFLLGGSVPNQEKDNITRPVPVHGPGPAGGLPPKFGGGDAPTVSPGNPTPGIRQLTEDCHAAYAYSTNVFLRDMGIQDVRDLADVHEIAVPEVGAGFANTAPPMKPFLVMEDDRVRVSAVLVPHGPVFPAFAFRFDTDHGSVTFSGDTTYSDNLIRLAKGSDVLVHEAISVEGLDAPAVFVDHLLQSHVEVQKVGPIARRAGVGMLVLSHISEVARNPIDARQWKKWAQRGYGGEVVVGEDLQRIRLA